MTPFLTVFTPTYNRAHTLPQLYASLCRQDSEGFVWSIVDDGSTDNTEELVRGWMEEKKIPIQYYRQPNGGKMRAHNTGVRRCSTPLFVCVDSDDFVSDTFVDEIWENSPAIRKEPQLAGMIAYKDIRHGSGHAVISTPFPRRGTSTLGGLYHDGFKGETTLVFKTRVIRRFPFLEVEGETFSSEGYAYDQIDQEYEYLLVDKEWIMCAYHQDGYTMFENELYARNPKGCAIYYNQKVSFIRPWLNKEKLGYAISYMIYARRAGMKGIYRQSALKTPFYPLFWLLSYYFEYWKWREKYPR